MTLPKTLSLPVAVYVSAASTIFGAGIAYASQTGRISAAEVSTVRLEARVEKLERAVERMLPMLERIDERTARADRRD